MKDFTKNCYISPTPFAGSQQEHLALRSRQMSDQSILTQSKKREKKRKKENPQTAPPNHRTVTPEFKFKRKSGN